MSVFGFPEDKSGGTFTPVLKYDARGGRFTRVDRVATANGFEKEDVDITNSVKFVADFENIEIGWLNFTPGVAPDMRLVPMGTQLPDQPSPQHSLGLRFMLKLAKECGGVEPIREMAGTSKAFRAGIEAAYLAYQAGRDANPGKLPVFTLEKTTPVKTGTGARTSTNYHPVFKLVGWVPRADLTFVPKATAPAAAAPLPVNTYAAATGATPPSTGSTVAVQPAAKAELVSADDFG